MKDKNLKWSGFDYVGKIICTGNESTSKEMILKAKSDLHPKLKVISRIVSDIETLIPLYNNWLKIDFNKNKVIKSINILENSLSEMNEYIHS